MWMVRRITHESNLLFTTTFSRLGSVRAIWSLGVRAILMFNWVKGAHLGTKWLAFYWHALADRAHMYTLQYAGGAGV